MANNLSFTVRLELLADKFRQKAEGAMNALRGIQFQAIAMAGLLVLASHRSQGSSRHLFPRLVKQAVLVPLFVMLVLMRASTGRVFALSLSYQISTVPILSVSRRPLLNSRQPLHLQALQSLNRSVSLPISPKR